MLNNFRVFAELVFFDLWIPESGFRIPDSGFWFPDSGFRFQDPDSGFRVLGLPLSQRLREYTFLVSPTLVKTIYLLYLFTDFFGTKGQFDRFRFILYDMATAQKYCCIVSL